MAKNLRPTGRRTYTSRVGTGKTTKSRFQNKRVLAQRWRTTTYVPRSLYPPLPAQMRLSMKVTTSNIYGIAGATMVQQRVSCIDPRSIGDVYPCGFPAMMLLYSKAIIDKVQVKFLMAPFKSGLDNGYPLNVTGGVVPWVDTNGVALTLASFQLFASRPEAKSMVLGHPYANDHENMFFSVDVHKALANFREEHYAIKSDRTGVITLPNQATVSEAPVIALSVFNHFSETQNMSLQREITYHFTFSCPHTAPNQAPTP